MNKRFDVWVLGGWQEHLELADALERIKGLLDAKVRLAWEWREAGVDMEYTWNYNNNPLPTLRAAVDKVLPQWEALDLSIEKAALICMELGLIVSTGVEDEIDGAE